MDDKVGVTLLLSEGSQRTSLRGVNKCLGLLFQRRLYNTNRTVCSYRG